MFDQKLSIAMLRAIGVELATEAIHIRPIAPKPAFNISG